MLKCSQKITEFMILPVRPMHNFVGKNFKSNLILAFVVVLVFES